MGFCQLVGDLFIAVVLGQHGLGFLDLQCAGLSVGSDRIFVGLNIIAHDVEHTGRLTSGLQGFGHTGDPGLDFTANVVLLTVVQPTGSQLLCLRNTTHDLDTGDSDLPVECEAQLCVATVPEVGRHLPTLGQDFVLAGCPSVIQRVEASKAEGFAEDILRVQGHLLFGWLEGGSDFIHGPG